MIRLGVDTGGTFTDFVWLGADGRFRIHKQLSTPADPSAAILSGVQTLSLPDEAEVVHGTTVATNALLERRGAPTALITTAGFADVLAIGRQNRPDIYALVPQKSPPLVPQKWRFEVAERLSAEAEMVVPLNSAEIAPLLAQMAADGVESVAVCLLFSFLDPSHERQIADAIAAWQQANPQRFANPLHVSLSSDILPEYREYERTATTVINAYVAPLMARYLRRLAAGLEPRRLTVMQSNGGVISAQTAAEQAARTALSGPAGGVVGARFVASAAGFDELITFDMGGTSTDVALCAGTLPTTSEGEIADLPLRLPIIDIHTVGSGGGSLAYVDAGGALHVGPQSAGADPGPTAYGNSAEGWSLPVVGREIDYRATTTDANLVLGRLDADHFLGGTMRLDLAGSRAALARLAAEMGADSPEAAAWDVVQVSNANMERAIRRISVERGHDPRGFTLVAFGGAGPLHACELAQNMQIPRVLIPAVPGVLSALGMLAAAPTKDYSRTVLRTLSAEIDAWLLAQFAPLADRARTEMAAEGFDTAEVRLHHKVDMRYRGQSHELTIALGESPTGADLAQLFHAAHAARYGYQRDEAAIELVTVRLSAEAPVSAPVLHKEPLRSVDAILARVGEKAVWFGSRPRQTQLYDRQRLQPGNQFAGPAIVFQYDTTSVIPPNWQVQVDGYGNLVVRFDDSTE